MMFIFFYIMFLCFYEMMQIEINLYIIIFKMSIIYLSIKCHRESIIVISYLINSINFLLFLMVFNSHNNMLLMHKSALNRI